MARRDYVVEGAQLECTLGTAPGELVVTSQQKVRIKKKLKATNKDKMLKPPFFGSCTCSSPNPPCSPVLKEWQLTSKKSTMGDKTFLMADSKIQCEKGGTITIKDVGQDLVGTGKKEPELDDKYPELKGEIIFANGYLSESLGGVYNALFDKNPDDVDRFTARGHNVNEKNKIDDEDILLASELEETNNMSPDEIEADRKSKAAAVNYPTIEMTDVQLQFPMGMSPTIPYLPPINMKVPTLEKGTGYIDIPEVAKPIPRLTKKETKKLFWGYWNDIRNDYKGSQTYAKYFNAENREHFLNGSHGLGSNAAHRMDHGIAQGYHWAMYQWGIIPKDEVDETKEKVPYIESYSPAYKPITIVMHSQGNAPGVGFALGVMKYANELGWEQIPLNLIFLGVHQPKNLWEDEYTKFVETKVKYYGVDKDFWDGFPWSPFLKKDRQVHVKFANALSDLFDPEKHKLRNKRGIYEHLKTITDFDALKERAIQFTFCNDRGDLVIRDGDIPEIDSACNPKRDTSLYSIELYSKEVAIPEYYTTSQGKEIIAMEHGNLILPSYCAIPRIEVEKNKETGEEELKEWKDYRSIALDWGRAFSNYKKVLKDHKYTWKDLFLPNLVGKELELEFWHRSMLYHYGRIQVADLYAHFSPVGLLLNEKILENKDFEDGLGNTTIWDRIKKAGESKFYRVESGNEETKESKLSDEEKEQRRIFVRDYVEGDGQKLLIDTNIADNAYITKVIKAYVEKDKDSEKQLYHEPAYSEKELVKLQKMFGLNKQKKYQEELLKEMLIKKDNTKVIKPIIKNIP